MFGAPDHRGTQTVEGGRFHGVVGGNTLTSNLSSAMGEGLANGGDIVATLEERLKIDISPADEVTLRRGDLAERLLLAQDAGFGPDHQGDNRCVGSGGRGTRSSDQAWLRVDNPNGSIAMNLMVTTRHKDAFKELERAYIACRLGSGPCITPLSADKPDTSKYPYFGLTGTRGQFTGGGRNDFSVTSRDLYLSNLPVDPRTVATSVEIKVDDTTVTYPLTQGLWTKNGDNYKYFDRSRDRKIKSVDLKMKAGILSIDGFADAGDIPLNTRPEGIEVILHTGGHQVCMYFPGDPATNKPFFVPGKMFDGDRTPPPFAC